MLKAITVLFGVWVAAVPFNVAYANDDCSEGDWLKVLTNLKWTLANDEAKRCAFVKIQSGSMNAYEAFADCNSAFRDGGVTNPIQNEYRDCAPQVCNWFISERLTPAC
ncbi:hypothetical protein NKI25_01750 [Mesorhizobium sp. M0808]|uniref:hypothetical protein n=1 Tax=Mesorhizobium sp. M0808 TaxID=2957002 RepID=UPI00333B4635